MLEKLNAVDMANLRIGTDYLSQAIDEMRRYSPKNAHIEGTSIDEHSILAGEISSSINILVDAIIKLQEQIIRFNDLNDQK